MDLGLQGARALVGGGSGGLGGAIGFALAAEGARVGLVARPSERLERAAAELEGSIALARLAPDYRNSVLALGLSAVIEDADGALSYWALAHPAAKPDFHHREAFTLKIEPEA